MSVLAAHRYAAGRALAMVRDRPGAFLLAVLLAGSAMALPLALASVLWAARPVLAQLQPAPEITVFVSPRAGARDLDAMKERLATLPDVVTATVRPREAALAQLIARSGFSVTPAELGANPLPDVLIARLAPSTTADSIDRLAAAVKAWPLVDAVRAELDWYRKVQAIGRMGLSLVTVFGGLVLLLIALVLIGTVRLQAATRSDEEAVLRLVGAAPSFIVRPYAYAAAGMLAVAGLVASAGVYTVHAVLRAPLSALTGQYGSAYSLPAPEPAHALAVFLVAVVFGWLVGLATARSTVARR